MNGQQLGLLGAAAGLAAGTLALGAGMAYQAVQTRRDDRAVPGTGEVVEVDGLRTHYRLLGTERNGPTVILEAGLSCPLEVWGWVQPAIAESAPVLAYDRSGIGWSDRRPQRRSAAQFSHELEQLLAAVGRPGPYVLVGHSLGGLLVREFAKRNPDKVAGVVLVDASHPDQMERSPRQRLGMPPMRAMMRTTALWSHFGSTRMSTKYVVADVDDLPPAESAVAKVRLLTAKSWRAGNAEFAAWMPGIEDEVRGSVLPDDCPLFVLSAGQMAVKDPMHNVLQAELTAVSGNSTQHVVDEASHLGIVMNNRHARLVVAAVNSVLDAARTGRRMDTVAMRGSDTLERSDA